MMSGTLRKSLSLLFCLALLLCLMPFAMAAGDADAAGYETRFYDKDIIVGFQRGDPPTVINTEHKYALIELQKEFPDRLTVLMGGTVFYMRSEDGTLSIHHVDASFTQDIDVSWKCVEDYDDDDLTVFHFVPALREESLAEALDLPAVTVNVLGKLQRPPMPLIEEQPGFGTPKAGFSGVPESSLPSSYSSYERGVLPPIRDQNPYGTCWAFATIAAVEADLIHDGVFDTGIDLSELHLAYFNYHDFYDEKGCNYGDFVDLNGADYLDAGGSPFFASLDLANMIGPVQEADVPYSRAAAYNPNPADGRLGALQISNLYLLSTHDRASVKQAIIDHGAVATGYNDEDENYSATYNSYYYPTSTGTNHIVAIVGWDDSFSRNNFRSGTPEGDGAWLIRNSWGADKYDHGGYFWLSYYDCSLSGSGFALDAQLSRYAHIYAYDNMPQVWYWLVDSGSAIEQRFQVDAGEEIRAIGVYCEEANVNLAITVTCGNVSAEANLSIGIPGYYLVPLSAPISIIEKSDVNVQYIVTGSEDDIQVNAEGPYTYSPNINGTTYYIKYNSTRGSGLIIDGDLLGKDARIKLFTDDMAETRSPDLVLPADLTSIGAEALNGSFRYAQLPSMPVSIGPRAFANCPELEFIHIPPQVTDISGDAFQGLDNLTILGVAGSTADSYARDHGIRFMAIADEGFSGESPFSNG